jgi:hypothetical protein
VNASTSATAGDVFARTTGTGSPTAGTATATNIAAGGTAMVNNNQYIEVANASNFFQLYNTGTVATARATFDATNFTLPTSRNATVFFTDNSAFAVANCS